MGQSQCYETFRFQSRVGGWFAASAGLENRSLKPAFERVLLHLHP